MLLPPAPRSARLTEQAVAVGFVPEVGVGPEGVLTEDEPQALSSITSTKRPVAGVIPLNRDRRDHVENDNIPSS